MSSLRGSNKIFFICFRNGGLEGGGESETVRKGSGLGGDWEGGESEMERKKEMERNEWEERGSDEEKGKQ